VSLSTLLRTWSGTRGTGCRAEIVKRPLPDFDRLVLPAAIVVRGAFISDPSLALHLPDWAPLHQGATGSCVSQFWCLGEVLTMAARYGVLSPLPSRRAAYYWARQREGGTVVDDGCRPSSLLLGVAEQGLPPETSFPWSVARINQRPPLSARWDAHDHVDQRGSFQIYASRLDDRIAAVRAAVASGRAFGLSIPVGDTFDGCRDAAVVPWPTESTIRGYHMLTGLSCSADGVVHVVNSWGSGFGASGQAWLAPEYLARTSSLVVVDPEEPVK
jgi:hypothetical protein